MERLVIASLALLVMASLTLGGILLNYGLQNANAPDPLKGLQAEMLIFDREHLEQTPGLFGVPLGESYRIEVTSRSQRHGWLTISKGEYLMLEHERFVCVDDKKILPYCPAGWRSWPDDWH